MMSIRTITDLKSWLRLFYVDYDEYYIVTIKIISIKNKCMSRFDNNS